MMFKGTFTALFTVAVLVVNVGAQGLDIGCIDTGVSGNCVDFVDTCCDSAGLMMVRPLDNVSRCFNLNSTVKCDFTAWFNLVGNDPNSARPSAEHCKKILRTVSASCPLGGYGHITGERGFQFLVDPNLGPCGSNEANGNPS
ncbi:hypothetical protein FA15DRAFT_708078 [Coprinopsis marcescibilis]|uniref:Glycan binding protein Y3-like domain-containing protein n=1 Tax=Coprinopsis marcescibilis TaxID=230819 RepID=A0A5C3KKL3_COPMA|nr:hypothetical protein FA15DRAFT_708078 [Coprinopsis marcescibilis]